jgi:microcompartment protein CcmK/EutM
MILGKVVGEIYSTINHEFYNSKKLLLIAKLESINNIGEGYIIAVDTVDAGVNETVLVIDEGNSARQIIQNPSAPIRSIIIGIVDNIHIIK